MPKIQFDIPMYSLLVKCASCDHQHIIDCRAWDMYHYTCLYIECPKCSSDKKKYHQVLDAHLARDNEPLRQGEKDPNESITYAIKFIKTGGWLQKGYNFLGRSINSSYSNSWGVLAGTPFVAELAASRRFTSKRAVKSTITRYINRSYNKLTRSDFEVYEIISKPLQKVVIL